MADLVTPYEKGKLYDLSIADLQPDPEQPRKYFDEQALPKLSGAPVDLTFVDQFYDRIYLLDSATLTNDQKVSLNLTIVKMRSMLLEKTHKLKVPVTVTA